MLFPPQASGAPTRRRGLVVFAVALATASLSLTVTPSHAAERRPATGDQPLTAALDTPTRPHDTRAVDREINQALQRDLGLPQAQAAALMEAQARATALQRSLPTQLGADAYGGAWFDRASQRLVVAVTTAQAATQAHQTGAMTTTVARSHKTLDGIMRHLDSTAKSNRAALASAVSWYVDEKANQVVVRVVAGHAAQVAPALAGYGAAVHVEETTTRPTTTAADMFIDGGEGYAIGSSGSFNCSVGFNVLVGGVRYIATAGHCSTVGATASLADASGALQVVGSFTTRFFPTWDDSLIKVTNDYYAGGYFAAGPWVSLHSSGNYLTIHGATDSPVGSFVCKSGFRSGLTCGQITAKRVTVTYSDGSTVYNLDEHSACSSAGDSGGAVFSVSDAYYAEGTTSGGYVGSDGLCTPVNGRYISYEQPIVRTLSLNGATLVTG